MPLNLNQFRDFTVRRLQHHAQSGLPLYSDSAVAGLLGIAAHESGLGAFLRQIGGGPALGAYGIEPPTFLWLQGKYQDQFPRLLGASPDQLEWDLDLGLLVARLKLYVAPPPLPAPDDILGWAEYWFVHYNASGISNRKDHFMLDWKRFGLPWKI